MTLQTAFRSSNHPFSSDTCAATCTKQRKAVAQAHQRLSLNSRSKFTNIGWWLHRLGARRESGEHAWGFKSGCNTATKSLSFRVRQRKVEWSILPPLSLWRVSTAVITEADREHFCDACKQTTVAFRADALSLQHSCIDIFSEPTLSKKKDANLARTNRNHRNHREHKRTPVRTQATRSNPKSVSRPS